MNTQLLIDSIVRQVTVLIAQLATAGGVRAPVAHLANQVFVDLAHELEAQGVSRKVSADMFGMALRGYLRKLQRLTEGQSDTGRTLWQSVLDYIVAARLATRADILRRFKQDDQLQVSAVLRDLKDSGLVFTSGSGEDAVYRASTDDELGQISRLNRDRGVEELAWGVIYRNGPIELEQVAHELGRSPADVQPWVETLLAAGRVQRRADGRFGAEEFVLPLDSPAGWEAAVFDHVQAVVQTIGQRLRLASAGESSPSIGGSTYGFELSPDHPMLGEVLGLLEQLRARAGELRRQVDEYNRAHVSERTLRVVTYIGQCSVAADEGESIEP